MCRKSTSERPGAPPAILWRIFHAGSVQCLPSDTSCYACFVCFAVRARNHCGVESSSCLDPELDLVLRCVSLQGINFRSALIGPPTTELQSQRHSFRHVLGHPIHVRPSFGQADKVSSGIVMSWSSDTWCLHAGSCLLVQ